METCIHKCVDNMYKYINKNTHKIYKFTIVKVNYFPENCTHIWGPFGGEIDHGKTSIDGSSSNQSAESIELDDVDVQSLHRQD